MKALTFQTVGGPAPQERIFPITVETQPLSTPPDPSNQITIADIVLPPEAFDDDGLKEEYEPAIARWKEIFRWYSHTMSLEKTSSVERDSPLRKHHTESSKVSKQKILCKGEINLEEQPIAEELVRNFIKQEN